MSTTVTQQEVRLQHTYKVPGVILVIISLGLVAYDFGYLVSCGHGTGICVDFTAHRLGTALLILFFLVFVIGVIMIVYTGESTVVTRQATPPQNPPVTVVAASPQPAAPAPTTINVNPPRNP